MFSFALNLSLKLLFENNFQFLGISGEIVDTLVELIECHPVLEESPAEFRLVIDEGNFGNRVILGS